VGAELQQLLTPSVIMGPAIGRRIHVISAAQIKESELETKLLNCIKVYYQIENNINNFTNFWGSRLLMEVFLHASGILIYLFLTILWLPNLEDTSKLVISVPPLILYVISFSDLGGSCTRLVEESNKVLATLEELALEKSGEFSANLNQKVKTQRILVILSAITECVCYRFKC
jgi:hypothetical protein